MKKLLYTIFYLSLSFHSYSQLVSGQLIRLHNVPFVVDLNNLTNPLAGQLAFVIAENTSYQYDGTAWIPLGGNDTLSIIIDQDRDTWVRVDNGNDNDVIDFFNQGTHHFRMDEDRLEVLNSGESVFIGEKTGMFNIGDLSTNSGVRNVAVGYDSWSSYGGNDNVAVGYKALREDGGSLPSFRSVAIGSQSLESNIGSNNTAIGYRSLWKNEDGTNNSACGDRSLSSNKANNNSAFGKDALFSNTTGEENSAVGSDALRSNINGHRNTSVGYQSLLNNTSADNNSAFAYFALRNNTTGANNSAFGVRSLHANTDGSSNCAFGSSALLQNTSGDYNCAFGSPSSLSNTSGAFNVAVGYLALRNNSYGNDNCAIGASALILSTGSNNIGIGSDAQVGNAGLSNQVRVGNTSINSAAIQVPWSTSSDLHWKEKVRDLTYGLNLISKLRPVDYLRKNSPKKGREVGFIAQELVKVLQEVGFDNQGFLTQTDQGYYEVRYNDFIPIAIKGIQEQQGQIQKQQQQIEELKANYKRLLERLDDLEQSKN